MANIDENEDVKWLYEKMRGAGVNTGSMQDFRNSLDNDEDRKWYYQKAKSLGLDFKDEADFNSLYASKAVHSAANVQNKAASQSRTPLTTEKVREGAPKLWGAYTDAYGTALASGAKQNKTPNAVATAKEAVVKAQEQAERNVNERTRSRGVGLTNAELEANQQLFKGVQKEDGSVAYLPLVEKNPYRMEEESTDYNYGDLIEKNLISSNLPEYRDEFQSQIIPTIERFFQEGDAEFFRKQAEDMQYGGDDGTQMISVQRNLRETTDAEAISKRLQQYLVEQYGELMSQAESPGSYVRLKRELGLKVDLYQAMLVDYLVKRNTPKDTAEYWVRNFINSSIIFNAASHAGMSKLERQTQAEGLASYDAPSWAKVTSSIAGMALDYPFFAWGRGAINPVTQRVVASIGKKALIKSGAVATELTAEQMATRALMQTSGKIVQHVLPSAGSFGGYAVFSYPVQTYAQGGDYSVWEHATSILTEAAKGAALGMYNGYMAEKTMTLGGGKRLAAKGGAFLGEVGMFTAFDVTEQLAHGVKFRDIDFGESFEDQLAFIGGLKMQHVGGKVLGLAAGTKAREWKQFPQKFIEEFTAPDVREVNGVLWMRNNRKLFTENDYKELKEFGVDARNLQRVYGAMVASKTQRQNAQKLSEDGKFMLDVYETIMNSSKASDSLKSKLMFLMEGVVTTREPIMCGHGICQASDGKGVWLQTFGEHGEVVTSEYFANEESASRAAEERNYGSRGAVGNMLSLTRMVDQAIMAINEQDVCRELGIDWMKLNEAKMKSREQLTDEEKVMLREFEEGYKTRLEGGRLMETMSQKYGLDKYIEAYKRGETSGEMANNAQKIAQEIEKQAKRMSADELIKEWMRGELYENDVKQGTAAQWAIERRNEARNGVVEIVLTDGTKAELLEGDIKDPSSKLIVKLKDGKVIQTTSDESAGGTRVDRTKGERVRSEEDAAAEHARAESIENLKGGEEVTLLENGDPRTTAADGKKRVSRGLVVEVNKEKDTITVEVLQDGQRTGVTRTMTTEEAKENISTAKYGECLYADKDGEPYMIYEFRDGRVVVTDMEGNGVETFNSLEEAKEQNYEIVEDKRAKVDLPSADAEGTGAGPTEAPKAPKAPKAHEEAEAAAPAEEPQQPQPTRAIDKLPMKKDGKSHDFVNAEPTDVAEALVELAQGNYEKAKRITDNLLAAYAKDLEAAKKRAEKGVTPTKDPEADMAAEAKLQEEVDAAQRVVDHFNEVRKHIEEMERDPERMMAAEGEGAEPTPPAVEANENEVGDSDIEQARQLADAIGFAFGTKEMKKNGSESYSLREIWLDEALKNGVGVWRSILGHEMTHAAKDVNANQGSVALWTELRKQVKAAMGEEWERKIADCDALYNGKHKLGLSIEAIEEEVISDWIGENLFQAEPERVKALLEKVSKNDGNAEGFLGNVVGMLDRALEALRKLFGAESEQAVAVEMAKRTWESMYEYAARLEKDKQMNAEENARESNEKHSLRVLEAKPWENDSERITDKDVMEQRGEVESVKYSINKSDEIEQNSNSYYDTYYEGKGEKVAKFAPIRPKEGEHAITRSELEVANAVIKTMVDYMKPFMDATSEGKRILPEEVYGKGEEQTIMKNGSYGRTMENTTLCLRTLAYNDFVDNVKKNAGRPLTQEESFLASQMVYEIARDPQCLYCYVSLDRKAYDDFLLKYIKGRDAIVEKFNALPEAQKNYGSKAPHEAFAELYAEFLDGRKDTKNMKARFDMWIDTVAKGGKLLTADQLTTQEVRAAIREGEDKSLAAQMVDAEAYAQGASWAKKNVDYRSYTGELLKLSSGVINKLKNEYGLRFYSFSEYTPAFIVENMQMVRDAALRGLKGLAYTKETDFVRIFAPTGMNINCSIYGREDADGNVVADTRQGADWEEVKQLRDQYGNVGCVFVATNDKMVEWALEQDFIDVIIPFHIVRTGDDIADFYGWENYRSEQADKQKGGSKKKLISPTEHHNDKETFLRLCEEQDYMPRFHKWLTHPNYMRLVNETRRSVDETDVIKPNFNLEAAKESFDNFVDKGGYYGGWWDVDSKGYQEAVERVVSDVNEGRRANEVDYGRQDMPINTDKLMQTARKHRQHMNKPITFGDTKHSLRKEAEMFEKPVKRDDENMGEFAIRMRDYNQAEAERAKVDANNVENVTEMDGSADVKYSIVKDEKELERLNNDPKGYIEAYCSVAKIGDLYYSPMATKTTESYTTKNGKQRNRRVMSEGMRIGDWDRSVERTADDPNIRVTEDGRWEYHLVKPDGSDMWVAYNPYEHSTMSPLNDQFTSAYHRPELRIVKVRIPISDLDGYKAEGAKDAVGEMSWHEGPVSAALKGTPNERKVILSRYRQIVEEVSVEDEADAIYEVLKDVDVRIPINVVRPELREELAKRGLKFGGIKGQVAEKDVQVLNEILARINGEEPTTPGGDKPSDKSEGTGADDTKYCIRVSKNVEDFKKTYEECLEKNGIVAKDLDTKKFDVLKIDRHHFGGTGKQAIENARKWAYDNLVKVHVAHKGTEDEFSYEIVGYNSDHDDPISKMLSSSATSKSANLGSHIAVLMRLPDVIENSKEVEIHADYIKKDGKRSNESLSSEDGCLMHIMYGAVEIAGDVYKVRTTFKEDKKDGLSPYTYKVTEINLLISGSTANDALNESTSVSGAKLLKGIYKSKENGKNLLDASREEIERVKNEENNDTKNSLKRDEEYAKAVESGDVEKVQDMLAEEALAKGYISNEEYRMSHRAPHNDGYNKPLHDVVGVYPEDVYSNEGLRYYGYEGELNRESWNVMRKVRNNPDALVTIYRTVPIDVKETEVRNGDWITTSRAYAEEHRHHINGRTRIIEQKVPAKYVWTNGDSLSEYGYDDGKTYVHKNTKNGRKLLEPTYDDEGNLIPLSERFNSRRSDIRYSLPKEDAPGPVEQFMEGLRKREDDASNARREEDMRLLNNRLASDLMVAAELIRKAHDANDDVLVDKKTSDAFTKAQEAADKSTSAAVANITAAREEGRKSEAKSRDALQTEMTRLAKRLISGMDGVGQKEMNELLAEMRDVQKVKTAADVADITRRMMDTVLRARERKAMDMLDDALRVRGKGTSAAGGNAMKSMDEAHAKTIEGLRKRIAENIGADELQKEKDELMQKKSEFDEDNINDVQRARLDEVNRQLDEIQMYEQYRMNVADYDESIRGLKRELAEAETEEQRKAIQEAIVEERTKKLKALSEFVVNLKNFGKEGVQGKRDFLAARQKMEDEVNHAVNSDTKGLGFGPEQNEGFAWLGGLSTLNGIMKFFGRRAADGKGRLWHMFIPAHQIAIETRQLGFEAANEMLNAISKKHGYKTWSDMGKYAKDNSGTLYRLEAEHDGKRVVLGEDGKPVYKRNAYTLTLDNLLYIHACEKMSDGRMKLRKMGITEKEVERIREWFMEDPKRKALMEAIDECQSDVLSKLKEKYNVTHRKLFGVAMSDVEDYFPLRLDKRSVNQDEQVGGNNGSVMPSTMTGAIKKRVRNSLPLDITGTGAFEVTLGHILEMETWNAFAPLKERANMLLNNKNLKYAVDSMKGIYGSGQTLMETLRNNLEVATECYKPKNSSLSKIALFAQSGITLRNIAFNLNTARKQLTSIWAELGYADPVHILRNVFRMPLANYFWAMENLPSLRARKDDGDMGYHELKQMDKGLTAFQVLDKLRAVGRVGMIPNKMVDVWVCAHVARACYDTQLAYYKKSGLSNEVAERKAKTDAEIAFNETQQSSQGAFMSEIQSRHSVGSTMLTTYRNSPMSYQRVMFDATRNLRRQITNRKEMIDQRTNMWIDEGIDAVQARKNAKRDYLRGFCQNIGQMAAVFTMNMAWYMSPVLAYQIFGKDDDKKREMRRNAFWLALTDDFVQGIPGFGPAFNSMVGNVLKKGGTMKNAFQSAMEGDWDAFSNMTDNVFPQMLLFEEVGDSFDNMFSGEIVKMAIGASNHLGSIGFGTSPKVVGNIVNGVINACKYDMDASKKWLFGIMAMMSHPKDAQEQLFVDLMLDALGDDYAERVEQSEDGKVSVKGMEQMNDYYGEIRQAFIEFNRGRDLGLMGIGYDAEKTEEDAMEAVENASEEDGSHALQGRWATSMKSEEKAIKRLQKLINERNMMHKRIDAQ